MPSRFQYWFVYPPFTMATRSKYGGLVANGQLFRNLPAIPVAYPASFRYFCRVAVWSRSNASS